MNIINGQANEIINSSFIQRFCIIETEEPFLLIALLSGEKCPFALAWYQTAQEAEAAFSALAAAFEKNRPFFRMPPNSGCYKPIRKGEAGA